VRAGRLDGLASGGRGVHAALAFVLELESPAGLGELGAGHAQPLGRSVATIVQRVEPLEREVRRRQEPVGQNRPGIGPNGGRVGVSGRGAHRLGCGRRRLPARTIRRREGRRPLARG
jgi:hypothetical protein